MSRRVWIIWLLVALWGVVPVGMAYADGVGLVETDTGLWHLEDGSFGVVSFYFGDPGDVPFAGDWTCDGIDTPGLFRTTDGFVYLRFTNTQGRADVEFFFGNPGDIPLAGDFDGDGCDTVSVYRPSEARVYIVNELGNGSGGLGAAESSYEFGNPGDVPFVGDFDGDGVDEIGLHRESTGFAYLRNTHTTGVADVEFYFGDPGDGFIAGDWDGDGVATPGVFRPPDRLFFLRDTNGAGDRDRRSALCTGAGMPISGEFGFAQPAVTPPSRDLTLRLDPTEALPLGDGVWIEAVSHTGSALIVGSNPVTLAVPDTGDVVRFTYVGSDGLPTGTCWRQTVDPAAGDVVVIQPWRAARPEAAGGVVLAWQSGTSTRHLSQLDAAPGLNVTSPVWWHIRSDGSLSSSADPVLVDAANERGLALWPAIASLEPDRAHAAFSDPEHRRVLAEQLSNAARSLGVDGVNLDIEGYRVADAAAVAAFAAEVTELVHGWGGVTSVDVTSRSEDWQITVAEGPFWSTAPMRRELSAAVDYMILMAYDQHNRVRPAGPVAADDWVENGLRYLLRFSDPDRVILGVPFYGRIWDPNDLSAPTAVGLGTLADLVASGTRTPDPVFGVDRVDLPDGRFTWAELPDRLSHRVGLIEQYGLAGVAAWRLGFDPPEVWPVIAPR